MQTLSLFLASIDRNVCQQAKRTGQFLIVHPVSRICSLAGLLMADASVDWRTSRMMLNRRCAHRIADR